MVNHGAMLIIIGGLALSPTSVVAGEDPAQLFRQAVALFGAADFEGSLGLLERAGAGGEGAEHGLRARILLYVGLNQAVMGHKRRARASFRAALLQDPAVDLDPDQFKPDLVALFRAERRLTLGRLDIAADLTGAEVRLDGKPAGTVPLSRYLRPGRIHVEVGGSAGARAHAEQIRLEAGQTLRLALRLSPTATQPTPGGAKPAPGRVATWVLGGAGVACLVAGAVLGGLARADHESWQDLAAEGKEPLSWQETREAGQDKQLAANVLLGVGGGLAAAGVALFFLEPRWASDDKDTDTKVNTIQLGPGPAAGLGLRGSF